MKKFLVIYLGGATASEKSIMPDEKAQHEFMMAWANWAEKHKDAVIDFGCPLSKSKSIHPTGVRNKVNKMTAYSIVQAESHEKAVSIFRKHPHLNLHMENSIEIIGMMDLPEKGQ